MYCIQIMISVEDIVGNIHINLYYMYVPFIIIEMKSGYRKRLLLLSFGANFMIALSHMHTTFAVDSLSFCSVHCTSSDLHSDCIRSSTSTTYYDCLIDKMTSKDCTAAKSAPV